LPEEETWYLQYLANPPRSFDSKLGQFKPTANYVLSPDPTLLLISVAQPLAEFIDPEWGIYLTQLSCLLSCVAWRAGTTTLAGLNFIPQVRDYEFGYRFQLMPYNVFPIEVHRTDRLCSSVCILTVRFQCTQRKLALLSHIYTVTVPTCIGKGSA
jgi:hypothetical protein